LTFNKKLIILDFLKAEINNLFNLGIAVKTINNRQKKIVTPKKVYQKNNQKIRNTKHTNKRSK